MIDQLRHTFAERYGEPPPIVVRAPGRVNLIGEHTDYNDGFVLPMAIERAVYIALRPTPNKAVRLVALDFDTEVRFSLEGEIEHGSGPGEYVRGMAQALNAAGYPLEGFEGLLAGDVPVGAGLSSSAAMEMAVGQALAAVGGFEVDPKKLAQMGQWVENEWLGLGSGIMDQMISAAGVADHALLIDCRSLALTPVPLPDETVVAILDTGTRRELVGSAYNERRQQCEAAADFFGVAALRDVTPEQFGQRADGMAALPRQRARHVITENARVLEARDALQAGNATEFGRLMSESHASLRDDFEVSSPALDAIVRHAQNHPASYGARMTGGGFAGCAVALVRRTAAEVFAQTVAEDYATETGHEPQVYLTRATAGAGVVT